MVQVWWLSDNRGNWAIGKIDEWILQHWSKTQFISMFHCELCSSWLSLYTSYFDYKIKHFINKYRMSSFTKDFNVHKEKYFESFYQFICTTQQAIQAYW